MAFLSVNKINVGGIIASSEDPKGARRNVGGEAQGSDGSTRITRQTRKRDLKLGTIPLSASDALAWESLFIGEGEVWSFDGTLYSSKGLGPSANTGCTATVSGTMKFGIGKLNVPATTGTITFSSPAVNIYQSSDVNWTVEVWRSTDSGATWTNYIVRGTGATQSAKWVDGVRNDAATTTWMSMSSGGALTIANVSGSAVQYDDLTVLPYWVLDTWPPQLGVSTTAWPPLPYLDIRGTAITEQPARRVFGEVDETVLRTAGAAGSSRVKLSIDLKAR